MTEYEETVQKVNAFVQSNQERIRLYSDDHKQLRKTAIEAGFDTGPSFNAYKEALKVHLGLDYGVIRDNNFAKEAQRLATSANQAEQLVQKIKEWKPESKPRLWVKEEKTRIYFVDEGVFLDLQMDGDNLMGVELKVFPPDKVEASKKAAYRTGAITFYSPTKEFANTLIYHNVSNDFKDVPF